MNTDKLNKWLTLAANVAVVAGIVFLVLELNQNSRMMRTQTRSAVTQSIVDFQFNGVTSGLQDLAFRGNADPSSLSQQETQKLVQFYVSNLRIWENIHYLYRNGVFDEDEFLAETRSWNAIGSRTPMLRTVYCNLRQNGALSVTFVTEMDTLGYMGECATSAGE